MSKELGENIKKAREAAGLTQEQLGAMVGITGVAIMRYEKGLREPKLAMVDKLAGALGVTRYDLTKTIVVEVKPIVDAILKSLPDSQKTKQPPDPEELSESELMLLSAFRSLTEDQKRFVLRQLQAAAQDPGDPGAV